MSTRALVLKGNKNGELTGIYCHHEGYPAYLGKVLTEKYSGKKLESLIKQGSASFIAETLKECDFYARDRKEAKQILEFMNLEDVFEIRMGQDYVYINLEGEWLFADKIDNIRSLRPLTKKEIEKVK